MKKILILTLMLGTSLAIAKDTKVRIKYEKNQKVDLSAIAVDGEIFAPGDLSIADEEGWNTESFFERKNYRDKVNQDMTESY